MRHMLRTVAAAAAVVMLATACGDAPDDEADPATTSADDTGSETADDSGDTSDEDSEPADAGSETADADSDVSACLVTDEGGVDDRSFNATAWAGVTRAEDELGISSQLLESTDPSDYQPNVAQFVQGDCTLIVTVGFALDAATQTAAQENEDQLLAIVDQDFAEFDDAGEYVGDVTYDNVRELTFQTDQAAFLAGYLAASETETGTIGTYGGRPFPTVTIFMDGLLAGVQYYNEENGTEVEVLGWDGTDGQFTGDFESQDNGRRVTESLLQDGADIIMPVAGPVGLGTIAAVEDANAGGAAARVIWVDTDGTVSVPEYADMFLTSVMKNMDVAVFDTISQVVNDDFQSGLYSGTLENDGVAIATDKVEGDMSSTLDELRQMIIDGEIETRTSAG